MNWMADLGLGSQAGQLKKKKDDTNPAQRLKIGRTCPMDIIVLATYNTASAGHFN